MSVGKKIFQQIYHTFNSLSIHIFILKVFIIKNFVTLTARVMVVVALNSVGYVLRNGVRMVIEAVRMFLAGRRFLAIYSLLYMNSS